jgi:hypothetical protein
MSHARKTPEWPTMMQPAAAVPASLFDLWARSSEAYLNGLSGWMTEAAQFSSRRLEKDQTTINGLRNCSTWSDLATWQMRWATTAVQDYLAEAGRAGQLLQRSTAGAARDVQQRHGKAREAA